MANEQGQKDYTTARIGFVTMVTNDLRMNNEPVIKQVKQGEVALAEAMGYRPYVRGQAPTEAKTFNPALAKALEEQKAAREKAEMERLQRRVTEVVTLGGIPDLEALKTASEDEYQAAIAELQPDTQTETRKPGRPAKA